MFFLIWAHTFGHLAYVFCHLGSHFRSFGLCFSMYRLRLGLIWVEPLALAPCDHLGLNWRPVEADGDGPGQCGIGPIWHWEHLVEVDIWVRLGHDLAQLGQIPRQRALGILFTNLVSIWRIWALRRGPLELCHLAAAEVCLGLHLAIRGGLVLDWDLGALEDTWREHPQITLGPILDVADDLGSMRGDLDAAPEEAPRLPKTISAHPLEVCGDFFW